MESLTGIIALDELRSQADAARLRIAALEQDLREEIHRLHQLRIAEHSIRALTSDGPGIEVTIPADAPARVVVRETLAAINPATFGELYEQMQATGFPASWNSDRRMALRNHLKHSVRRGVIGAVDGIYYLHR